MKTTQLLLDNEKYLDGSPLYKGDINRMFSSQLVIRVEATVVKAPEGAKLLTETNDELEAAMRKLKFGQIGALKSNGTEISNSEVLYEVVVPVTKDNVLDIKDKCLSTLDINGLVGQSTCIINGERKTVKEVKALLAPYRESNTDIRKRWIAKSKELRSRNAAPEEMISIKRDIYKEYVSISKYSMALSVNLVHIVNNPKLNSTVICNIDQDYYDSVNYSEGKVRKVAEYSAPIVSFPINNLENYKTFVEGVKSLTTTDNAKLGITAENYAVLHETDKVYGVEIDFQALKAHDSAVTK